MRGDLGVLLQSDGEGAVGGAVHGQQSLAAGSRGLSSHPGHGEHGSVIGQHVELVHLARGCPRQQKQREVSNTHLLAC